MFRVFKAVLSSNFNIYIDQEVIFCNFIGNSKELHSFTHARMTKKAAQLAFFLALGSSLPGDTVTALSNDVAGGHKDPYTPVGSISVTPTVVQPGVRPRMVWGIKYPESVADISELDPNGTISLQQNVDLKIRVMGVALQAGSTQLPAALWVRVGASAPWELIFYGREGDVQPDEIVFEKSGVPANTQIDFSARSQTASGTWYETQSTSGSSLSVIGMVDGDKVPDFVPAYEQGRIESFMTQFLDEENHVVLGPRDIIHTFELGTSSPGAWWFDMQDIVCMTTLSQVEEEQSGVDRSQLETDFAQGGIIQVIPGTVDDRGVIKLGRR